MWLVIITRVFILFQDTPIDSLHISTSHEEWSLTDDSGFYSLNSTASSFVGDITNSSNKKKSTSPLDSSGFLCDSDRSSLGSDSETSLSERPSFIKQLSFESPILPSKISTRISTVKPRRSLFSDNIYERFTDENICEASRSQQRQNDFVYVSPGLYRKDKPEEQKYARSLGKQICSELPSNTKDMIEIAMHMENSDCELVGDFSRLHSLSTVPGKHRDLKSITADTLAELLTGIQFPEVEYQIIDCRYPYEYEGGHIDGALNLTTQEQLQTFLNKGMSRSTSHKTILIFHCEFSSERGPKRARLLRSLDRTMNADYYPRLTFPEIYILDGGYKEFFNQYPDLCCPQDYIPMLHAQFRNELKKYRSSKGRKGTKRSLPSMSKIQLEY